MKSVLVSFEDNQNEPSTVIERSLSSVSIHKHAMSNGSSLTYITDATSKTDISNELIKALKANGLSYTSIYITDI
ncbi:hypothetical protein KGV31_002155 [Vibrio parahaemolyticus]|nr:hypothetical protein [Vibrio parahaemolyticus]EHU0344298.1 hypothetical protein [Vibrio parahaemolyticus]EHU0354332.1 hypothetical protein [Vibrio parahaemolyticus]